MDARLEWRLMVVLCVNSLRVGVNENCYVVGVSTCNFFLYYCVDEDRSLVLLSGKSAVPFTT